MVNMTKVDNWCKVNGAEWDRDCFGGVFVWFPKGGHLSKSFTHTVEAMWDDEVEERLGEEYAELAVWEEMWMELEGQVRLDCTDRDRCEYWDENRDRCTFDVE